MSHPTDPSLTFVSYISGLVLAASVYLGDQPDPMTGMKAVNLTSAGHAIDVLTMLEEKTRGNLSDDERRLLEGALYELRLKYVEASRKGPSRIVSP
ncbi:DUF1844 domain-containing protein [Luteitalea sp.]|jgi:hypothetical protein|uniref:DUF1844 domain-containing protein n=1 Tax=Luteitalea sp. TaxID=2004800 RepID=UPI0037C6BA4C